MITDPCEIDFGYGSKEPYHMQEYCQQTGRRRLLPYIYQGKCTECGKGIHPNVPIALKFKDFNRVNLYNWKFLNLYTKGRE